MPRPPGPLPPGGLSRRVAVERARPGIHVDCVALGVFASPGLATYPTWGEFCPLGKPDYFKVKN